MTFYGSFVIYVLVLYDASAVASAAAHACVRTPAPYAQIERPFSNVL